MRADFISREQLAPILEAVTPMNRLALKVSLATGLRIDDVLSIKTQVLAQRMTVVERKTGKKQRVYIPAALFREMSACAGKIFVFENRLDERKHRTRQAVYKDLRKCAQLMGVKPHISPHSCRKIYAVEQFRKSGDVKRVQALLNHSSEAVTYLYALADLLTEKRLSKP